MKDLLQWVLQGLGFPEPVGFLQVEIRKREQHSTPGIYDLDHDQCYHLIGLMSVMSRLNMDKG